jgi:four helix bundle protein
MARFIQISMGSGAELSYHLLLLARDLDFLKNTEYSRLNPDLEEVLRMLSSLSQKVRNAVAA